MPTTRFGDVIPDFHLNTAKPLNTFQPSGADGVWGEASNWSQNRVPTLNDRAHIPAGKTALIVAEHTNDVYCIHNEGVVYFATTVNTCLRAKHFLNNIGGAWQMGHPDDRIQAGVTCKIQFANLALENTGLSDFDPSTYGNGFIGFGGTVSTCAQSKNPIGELAEDAAQGNAYCVLTVNPQTSLGWKIGDELFFPTTVREDFLVGSWVMKCEYRVITGFDTGNKVLFTGSPLTYSHTSMNFDDSTWEWRRTQIQNITQPIVIESVSPTGTRGHVIILDSCVSDFRNALFLNLGRTNAATIDDTDGTHIGTNQIGRYPLHWHKPYPVQNAEECVFSARGTLSTSGTRQADPRRWAMAVHDAHYSTARRCVAHGYSGAGFAFAEGGNEYEDLFENCVASRISGDGDRDEITYLPHNHGNGGHGFWGHSIKVRLRNNAAYDVWGGNYSASLYLNNNLGNAALGGLDHQIPTGPGVDRQVSSTTFNNKKSGILEVDGFLSVACRSGPVLWHIGTHNNGGINPIDPPPRPPEWQYAETPASFIKNLYFYNCMETGFLQYEMVDCTFDGFFAKIDDAAGLNDAVWYWGDYVQIQTKMKHVRLQGACVVKTPSVMSHRIGVETSGSFRIEDLKGKTNNPPIAIRPWSDIAPGGWGGSHMALRTGDLIFTRCDRVNAGPVFHANYATRNSVIQQVGGSPNPDADQIVSGSLDQQAFNLVARQRIFVFDHRGAGQNYRVWLNGTHKDALAPYSLTGGGLNLRGWGIGYTDKTNEWSFINDGTCAFGELMHGEAVAFGDVVDSSAVQTTQIVDDGDGSYSASGQFVTWTPDGFAGDLQYSAQAAPADSEARWTFTVPQASHKVAITWLDHANRATNSPFTVLDAQQIIDDSAGTGFTTTGSGFAGFPGEGYAGGVQYCAPASPADSEAIWTFNVASGYDYEVWATWTPHANRATNSPFKVFNGLTQALSVAVNQELAPVGMSYGGSVWQRLGQVNITGTQLIVKLTNDANEYVVADAILIRRVLHTEAVNQQVAPADFQAGGKMWKRLNGGNALAVIGTTLVVKLTNAANGYVIADAVQVERVL